MTNKPDKIEYIAEDDTDKIDDKLKRTKAKLKTCEHERAEYLAGWQRAKADYINLQREHEKKIADYFKFANEGLILELLPILDSLDFAIQQAEKLNEKHATADDVKRAKTQNDFCDFAVPSQSLAKGINQIRNQLMDILKSNGLEQIKALGEKFDPNFHEAVGEVENYPEQSRGTELKIVEEIQKGYKLHGKVIRPSKVKIGK